MSPHPPGPPYSLDADETGDEATTALSSADASWFARLREEFGGRRWIAPLALFVLSGALYAGFAWERTTKPSAHNHFVYLADTLNTMLAAPFEPEAADRREGKLPFELNRDPPHQNDWASYWELQLDRDDRTYRGIWLDQQGEGRFKTLDSTVFYIEPEGIQTRDRRYFVSFPPGPAVLMMPFVAIWGYAFNDVLFTIVFGALNVLLIFVLLRRVSEGGLTGRGRRENLWLTALFAVGSAHFWCSVLGQVWFTALVVGITFTLLYLYFAIDARHPLAAGLALSFAFATRAPLVFTSIFFFAFVFFPGGRWRQSNWNGALRRLALFCAPCLVIGGGLLWMNEIRFGSPTAFGHRYLAGGSLERIQNWGLFNIHFLRENLHTMFTLVPELTADPPYIQISKHGMSILATTPALLWLVWPEQRESRADRFWWYLLWAVVIVTAVPALLYQNTGYAQFGYRFIMDYLPYLVLLIALGRRPLGWFFKVCVVAGAVVNGFGAATFQRMEQFYRNGWL